MAVVAVLICSGTARAADWYVDANYAGCATGTGGPNDPFCSITFAVAAASDGDTIHIAPATYVENVVLDKNLVLIGTAGYRATIVDGASAGSVFVINPGSTAAITGLSIIHGKAQYGGGIRVGSENSRDDGVLTLADCLVAGNTADDGGGLLTCGITRVERCLFIGNDAQSGGGISNYYCRSRNDFLSIRDSLFEFNTASFGAGFFNGTGGYLILEDCIFRFNQSSHSGGAGALDDDCLVELHRCVVASNSAIFDGGAIYNGYDGYLKIEDSILSDSAAGRHGGAIYMVASVDLVRSQLLRNRSGGNGGAVFCRASDPAAGQTTVIDSIVSENEAAGSGGGIYQRNDNGSGGVFVTRSEISRNRAGLYGGGIFGGSDCWWNSIFVNDSAILANDALVEGGGMYLVDGCTKATLSASTIAGNSAPSGGGVVNSSGATTELHLTIVAGNLGSPGPDCYGAFTSKGYNLVGDTSDCTITGDNTGNLLDVDPLFVDPAAGDYSLQPVSPGVDAGDPGLLPAGSDVAGNPRLLDGNLDRSMVVDMGAYEFDHVHLEVTGDFEPGGLLTFATTGTSGLYVFLLIGTASGERLLSPYGAVLIDLALPWTFVSFAVIPDTKVLTIPTNLPAPVDLVVQELAIKPGPTPGNFSNAVELSIE